MSKLRRKPVVVWGLAGLLAVLSLAGCKRLRPTDTGPLYQAGMWDESIRELRKLSPTNDEITDVARAREAGLSDAACVELVRLAHERKQPFSSGDAVANLVSAGVAERTILELARLDQLGLWSGEAMAMRLAGLSDQVILAVARRRAAGLPVMSGSQLARLQNVGMSEPQLLGLIAQGVTDAKAEEIIAYRERALAPSGFVRQRGRRR